MAVVRYTAGPGEPASPTAALVGDVAVSVIVVALVGGAFWSVHSRR